MTHVGLIGYGYWGPNLLRNFMELPGAHVVAMSDLRVERIERARNLYPGVETTTNHLDIINRTDIDAIAIATPVSTHFPIAMNALKSGKHVLVEKPLAASSDEARRLIDEASRRNLVLMVGHTFVYSPAVRKIKDIISEGQLGELYYYDAVRINLGIFQHDVNVLWDLAVHDLSIMDFLIDARPCAVTATGISHIRNQHENIAYLTFYFDNPLLAHIHVNWLSPVKLRRTLIGASQKMIVYDDLDPVEKVKVYDSGVAINDDPESLYRALVDYRTGGSWAPKVSREESLQNEVAHFAECISSGKKPITGGEEGLRVIRFIESACASIAQRGHPVEISRDS